jgi:hypothetical protein
MWLVPAKMGANPETLARVPASTSDIPDPTSHIPHEALAEALGAQGKKGERRSHNIARLVCSTPPSHIPPSQIRHPTSLYVLAAHTQGNLHLLPRFGAQDVNPESGTSLPRPPRHGARSSP